MTSSISTIDAYINQFEGDKKAYLIQIYKLIAGMVPTAATETISYQMPTFRLNGNLIHFAMNKQHLGIYPGPDAIEHFAPRLKAFKTTKGAIQIPIDQPIPEKIILDIVAFNIEKFRDKQGPNWHKNRGNWLQAEEMMQQIVLKTTLKKEFKWGKLRLYTQRKECYRMGRFQKLFLPLVL